MKVWYLPRYGSIDDLYLDDMHKPALKSNEVLVEVKAVALNPADLMLISGRQGGRFLRATKFPIIPGFDFSGLIRERGEKVRDLKMNQGVFGFLPYQNTITQGALASLVPAQPEWVCPKPENVSHAAAAAAATVGSTAIQALRDKGALKAGQDILINGASGGVGSFAVQIAKNAGATVWGTCSGKHMDFVRSLGADRVLDYRASPLSTIQHAFDTVLDAASTSSFFACRPLLKRGGNYITLRPSVKLAAGIVRSIISSRRCRFVAVSNDTDDLARLAAWLAAEQIQSPISHTFDFADAPRALRMQENGVRGKIVVSYQGT